MVTCCIHGCSSRSGRDNVTFHRIPKVVQGCPLSVLNSRNQRTTYFARINRKTINDASANRNTVVCSRHFISGKPAGYMNTTNPDWAPSLLLGHEIRCKPQESRYQRRVDRFAPKRKPLADVVENNQDVCDSSNGDNIDNTSNGDTSGDSSNVDPSGDSSNDDLNCSVSVECQTEVGFNLSFSLLSVECQTEIDLNDFIKLFKRAQPVFSEEHLTSDAKCRFYTGVPSLEVLKILFDLVEPHIKRNYKKTSLTKFQEFVSVLARLRLDLLEEDIADRLNVSQSCISKMFNYWIPIIAQCLKHLIVWPDRETLRKTMPECFLKNFGRSVAVVIDCFEVRAPTPSGLLAKAQTYSHYKKNSTVKFLIGITPQGTISYISEAWGGRTSDKFITEHSKDFIDKLIPGDVILADRGFDIGVVTGEIMARVITPSFMHGRSQLSSDDVQYSRSVANVRIHVERLIGLVRRKFLILENRLNFSMLQHGQGQSAARIDHIVLICCAISNLCNAIVPMTEDAEAKTIDN